jgi:SAM-dependent methyltransferase
MTHSNPSFREFEQAGWEDAGVVANYHEHISNVTTQSVEALLDAVSVRSGSRVLDVATGAGYIAGAAARRGADVLGIDFSVAQVRLARTIYPGVRISFYSATPNKVLQRYSEPALFRLRVVRCSRSGAYPILMSCSRRLPKEACAAAATLRAQNSSAREAIKQALRDALAIYKRNDHFEVPAPAILATAIKPSM